MSQPSTPTFIGRDRELALLRRAYEGRESAFIPIYGRRRVGKSELIVRFLRDRPGLYYLGKKAPAALQMRELLREAAVVFDEPLLASVPGESWRQVLLTLTERWRRDEKLVIALDEFQWMVGASPELPSVLQECWDRYWRPSGRVFLILCGSYVGFMEREVLGRESPLFGRRTAQILLRPFSYLEAAAFHPSWSPTDRARAWFICGGIPLYLRFFDERRSIERNIRDTLLDEFGPLHHEPDFLLREELREVESYYAVLLAIASGHVTARAIAGFTGLPERSLHYYIHQLVQLGYLAKRHPLTGKRPNPRRVRYVLEDPLLRFWFRFVYPNTTFLQQMGPERTFEARVAPHLDAWCGLSFERLCREALPHLYAREGLTAAFQVGEYWNRDVQIDVVGLRDDNWTDLGECKWGWVRSPAAVVAELEAKSRHFPNDRGATLALRCFTRVAPRGTLPAGVRWHSLSDLYDAP